MKNKLLVLFIVILCIGSFVFSGCGKLEKDPNKVTSYLKNLEHYSTDAKMVIKNDKQNITYILKQVYSKEDGYALTLDEDRIFIYKGDKTYIQDLNNGKRYTQEKGFDFLYKLSFVNEYIRMLYTNEEIEYSFENIEDEEYQLIHFIIPGTNRNFNKAILYANYKENTPKKVLIYDKEGKESVEITYENFSTDIQIDKSIFQIENSHDD